MIAEAVTLDVTIGILADADTRIVLCSPEALPELLGHGATEAEAVEDLRQQFDAIVWH